MRKFSTISLFGLIFLFSCNKHQDNTSEDYALGGISHQFPVSTAAIDDFDRGLLLLYSFEYVDASEAFLAAQKADKNETMAYWGEAMCYYKALWGRVDATAGREVMAKLGATKEARLAKTAEGLEREFWQAIEILYGEGELKDRNEKYTSHMANLYEKYPKDLEVAAFYSLGLMWANYGDQEYLDKSAEVAAGIIKENPTHPGGLHYMIHANDNPKYARMAKEAADKYAKVAPDAAHALHMPSHIYVALGMWNEVVSSNMKAYAASLNRIERKALNGQARGYHSMAWLHYGYLQQGNYAQAAVLLKEMMGYHKDATASNSYTIVMQNEQRIESGKWLDGVEPIDVNYSNLGLRGKSQQHFLRGLIAFDNNNTALIDEEIENIYVHIEIARPLVGDDGIAICSGGPTRFAPNRGQITKTNVVIHQMEALKAMLNNDDKATEMHLKEATRLEASGSYDPGPPFIAYPSFEQYGEWLLTKDRAAEALVQFDTSLKNRTNRSKALRGKIKALYMLERGAEAEEVQKILDVFWQKGMVAMN